MKLLLRILCDILSTGILYSEYIFSSIAKGFGDFRQVSHSVCKLPARKSDLNGSVYSLEIMV